MGHGGDVDVGLWGSVEAAFHCPQQSGHPYLALQLVASVALVKGTTCSWQLLFLGDLSALAFHLQCQGCVSFYSCPCTFLTYSQILNCLGYESNQAFGLHTSGKSIVHTH